MENKLKVKTPKFSPEIKSIKAPAIKAQDNGKLFFCQKFKIKIKIKTGHWPKKNIPIEGKKTCSIIVRKKIAIIIAKLFLVFDNKNIAS